MQNHKAITVTVYYLVNSHCLWLCSAEYSLPGAEVLVVDVRVVGTVVVVDDDVVSVVTVVVGVATAVVVDANQFSSTLPATTKHRKFTTKTFKISL